MKPATLQSLSTTRTVALEGKGATLREQLERAAWFRRDYEGNPGRVRWGEPRSTRVYRASQWTLAEAAMACKGLDDKSYQAIRFEYALDNTAFWPLNRALLNFAFAERARQEWPTHIISKPYIGELVTMHLLEVRQPWRFKRAGNQPNMHQALMDVPEHIWRRKMRPIYETLVDEYRRWLSIGESHMRRHLAESEKR